jgi:hypothetical protein
MELPRIKGVSLVRLRRYTVAVALATAAIVPAAASPAVAGKSPAARAAVSVQGKTPASKPAPVTTKFSASGTVTAVDAAAGTVTVSAKGGTKDVKGQTVTVKVPSTAKVVVNKSGKSLADIAAGFTITVEGTKTGTVYTATKVEAKGKKS